MKIVRILWISSTIFENVDEVRSGAWQKSLAIRLARSKEIVLGNVARSREVNQVTKSNFENIQQWAFPVDPKRNALSSKHKDKQRLIAIANEFKPDIIQIWGSENFLKLIPFDKSISGIKVLFMQGVLGSIAPYVLAGLTSKEILSTIGIRELIERSTLFGLRKSFYSDGIIENKMINSADFIVSHAEWVDAQVRFVNSNVPIIRTHRSLRPEFLTSDKWKAEDKFSSAPVIFSTAIGFPFKGLHTLLKAVVILKKTYPDIQLKIAGATGRLDFLATGYIRLLLRMVKKYDLGDNIVWLGPLNAENIIHQLRNASVYVHSSYAESYPNSLAEAMSIGTPSVVTAIGGIPEMATNNLEALFYAPHDFKHCAFQINKLLNSLSLSRSISLNAIKRAEDRNLKFDIVEEQLNIYNQVLKTRKQ